MSMLAVLRTPARRAAVAAPRAPARAAMRAGMRPSFRKYSTESGTNGAKSSSRTAIAVGVSAGLAAAAYYYLFAAPSKTTGGDSAKAAVETVKVKILKPTKEDFQKVYNEIAALLDSGDYDDGSYGPVLVRLAWHASGTYDKNTNTGGSNYATMRFEPESLHGANNGLLIARNLLEKVKEKHPWISYGDLWTLAGICSVQELGGPKIPWRAGRIDGMSQDAVKDERLPDASKDASHVRDIFYRMGFDDQEITALLGAHALGRCHPDRSGFEGPWTFSPTYFTNDFFKLLLSEKWIWRKWSGPKQLQDKATGQLMMLPADYAFVQDKNFKKYVKQYAEDLDAFFRDFSKAFSKLLELGVPQNQWTTPEPLILKTVDEQQDEKKKN